MKRFITAMSAVTLAAVMSCAASAANIGTIDNQYPGDTEAQAQMLYDLGLFKGTNKGFELERPMTRAEAAVMLTRLLGAEETALAENNTHPFTDVPEWASPYVGWLYENGLTKGTSDTTYTPSKNVTCEQYAIFLTRAARDSEESLIVGEDEISPCDLNGFTRGDAVSLSARELEQFYEKNGNSDGTTVALHLIESGVFTKEQLKTAAWDVIPRTYELKGSRGSYEDQDKTLSCVLAGVPVLRSDNTDIIPLWPDGGAAQVYGYTNADDTYTLYRIDPETLATETLLTRSGDQIAELAAAIGGTDYLVFSNFTDDSREFYAVKGAEVKKLDMPTGCQELYNGGQFAAFNCDDGIGVIDAEGNVQIFARQTEGNRVYAVQNGYILTQDITAEQTVITSMKTDGSTAGSVTVANTVPIPEDMEDEASWLAQYAPQFWQTGENGLFWGSAGLFRVEKDGSLTTLTARGVYDVATDVSDNSLVAIATDGGGIYTPAGNEIIRIAADGTETVLLSNDPDHGLIFSEISYANGGVVRAVYTYVMGMADTHSYEYAIENGRPRPLVHSSGSGFSGYTEEECASEQKRLDGIYTGSVSSIDSGTTGDSQSQMQLLIDLGLYENTYDNKQLQNAMTHEQAACVGVWFLGKAAEAKEQNASHPFIDVRSWSSPYIGWLYQNGMAQNGSETMFGADSAETCATFARFLTLAVQDSADTLIFPEEEIIACDEVGFVRGDAVSLMVRTLQMPYYKDGADGSSTFAEHLIAEGVFTEEEFQNAVSRNEISGTSEKE